MDVICRVVELKKFDDRISPLWVATEAYQLLDPEKMSPKLVHLAAHLELRQLARQHLRKKYDPAEPENEQDELFPQLQSRYPTARSQRQDDPEYVKLEQMCHADVVYNATRMRRVGAAMAKHADALEAWWNRFRRRSA